MSIKTNIQVNDGFSKPLQSMVNSLNMTISHFEKLQEVSNQPVDTQGLKYARNELANVDLAINNMNTGIRSNTTQQQKFTNEVNNTSRSMSDVVRSVLGIGTALMVVRRGWGKLKEGFSLFTDTTMAFSELQAVTEANQLEMDNLIYTARELGKTTTFSAEQATQGMIRLSRAGLTAYEVNKSIVDITNFATAGSIDLDTSAGILVDTMKGFNLTVDDTSRIVDTLTYASNSANTNIGELGQAFRKSASVASAFNSTIEESANLLTLMASAETGSRAGRMFRKGLGSLAVPTEGGELALKELGVDVIDPMTNDLRNLTDIVSDLAVEFEGLGYQKSIDLAKSIFGEDGYSGWLAILNQGEDAIRDSLNNIENMAEGSTLKMRDTMMDNMGGTMDYFEGKMEDVWLGFYEGLNEGVAGEAFKGLLDGLIVGLEVVLTLTSGILTVLGFMFNFIFDNLGIIIPLLIVISGLLLFKSVALAFIDTQLILITAKIWAILSPILLVIGKVILIVSAVYLVINAFKLLTGVTTSATGIIMGSIAVMVTFIVNLFMGLFNFIWNSGVNTLNGIISFAEFIANVFDDPIGSVARLFNDFGQYVLGILLNVAETIDTVFGSNLAGVVQTWMGKLQGFTDDKFGEGEVTLDRIDRKSPFDRLEYGNAWDAGVEFGTNLEDTVLDGLGDLFSFDKPQPDDMLVDMSDMSDFGGLGDGIGGLGDLGDGLGDINDLLEGIKDNTGASKDDMSIAKEDIQYLKDLARDTVVNRYTTNDIILEINNDNKISSDMDVDGVVNKMVDDFEDYIESGMEG